MVYVKEGKISLRERTVYISWSTMLSSNHRKRFQHAVRSMQDVWALSYRLHVVLRFSIFLPTSEALS